MLLVEIRDLLKQVLVELRGPLSIVREGKLPIDYEGFAVSRLSTRARGALITSGIRAWEDCHLHVIRRLRNCGEKATSEIIEARDSVLKQANEREKWILIDWNVPLTPPGG